MNDINTKFFKRCIGLVALALMLNPGFAQIAGWQFGSPAAAGNEVTYAATTLDANLMPGTTLSRGSGISPTSLARGFSANNWTAATKSAAVTNEQYFEFTIEAAPGHAVSLSSLDARMRRTSTGPNAYIWTYSLDGTTFNDIGSSVTFTSMTDGVAQPTINLSSISALQGVAFGTPVIFRLYAWGAQNTTGTFAIGRFSAGNTSNSLALGGTVAPTSTSNTSVSFATTTSSASEASGTANIVLNITDPSSTSATTATIAATGAMGRITGYSTSVTFPAGSSASAQVVVQLNDDALCNGDQDITFEITGISGGQGTPYTGINSTHVLTVTDDEQPLDPTTTAATGVGSNDFIANWDPVSGATNYFLDVSENPTFGGPGGTVVGWDFNDDDDVADSGAPQNAAQVITTNAAGAISYTAGVTGNSISADGWDGGAGIKYWQVEFNSTGLMGLTVSSAQRSSNTGPREFKLQYQVGGTGPWTDVPGGGVVVANNFTTGVLNQVPLPAACDDQAMVALRWIMATNVSVNGSTVSSNGTSRMDDIVIDADFASSFVPGYQNLSVGNTTSHVVTGLDPLTTYYYRVRSAGECSSGENSNTTTVTTGAGTAPLLLAGTLDAFGEVCLNTEAGPHSFTVTGTNLTTDDVTIGPLNGFTFSTTETGTYSASLSLAHSGGNYSQEVWVLFVPTIAQVHDGNIPVGGGGAGSIDVQASGTGINTPAEVSTGSAGSITGDVAELTGTIIGEGCSELTAYGIEYSSTQNFLPGTGTQAASTNLGDGSFSAQATGLAACTPYYFRAYATNAGGTAYGDEQSFTSAALDAPLAGAATGVLTNGFTANWGAVPGAMGYSLDVSTSPTFGALQSPGATTTETFTGIEGGNPGSYLTRNWTGDDGVEWTAYKARTDLSVFGTDDAITLQNQSGAYIESGQIDGGVSHIAFDVVQQFSGSGGVLTVKVLSGAGFATSTTIGTMPYTTTAGAFDQSFADITGPVKIVLENNTSARPVIDNLAFTRVESFVGSFVAGYEDLAIAGTSQQVAGLNMNTTYYYRVRAEGNGCSSGNSGTIAVTTLACAGNSIVVAIRTDANGDEISWELVDETGLTITYGGPYTGQNNTLITETVCLGTEPGCFGFRLYDTFGDGLGGNGFWQLRTLDGRIILGDDFNAGYMSPSPSPASPGYSDAHSFCLPLGPVNIAPTECGIFNNLMGNKVYAVKQAGKNYLNQTLNYQFEFSDPDAGFIRRIARPQNYVIFWDMVTNPLTPGVKYFARVRTDKSGPMAEAHWGTGCEMGISLDVLGCTGLIPAPAYGHSCNETRSFGNSSFIYATPVQAATEYEFRIFNTGEGYDQTFVRGTYILQLKWNTSVAPPLVNGYTYQVQARAKVGGVWGAYCGSTCSITINNSDQQLQNSLVDVMGNATLWPNPVRDGQVNLNIDGLKDKEQRITVDVKDIYGQQVYAREFGNSGDRFNTILNLPGDLASGVYMVQITINGQSTVQRLSIVR